MPTTAQADARAALLVAKSKLRSIFNVTAASCCSAAYQARFGAWCNEVLVAPVEALEHLFLEYLDGTAAGGAIFSPAMAEVRANIRNELSSAGTVVGGRAARLKRLAVAYLDGVVRPGLRAAKAARGREPRRSWQSAKHPSAFRDHATYEHLMKEHMDQFDARVYHVRVDPSLLDQLGYGRAVIEAEKQRLNTELELRYHRERQQRLLAQLRTQVEFPLLKGDGYSVLSLSPSQAAAQLALARRQQMAAAAEAAPRGAVVAHTKAGTPRLIAAAIGQLRLPACGVNCAIALLPALLARSFRGLGIANDPLVVEKHERVTYAMLIALVARCKGALGAVRFPRVCRLATHAVHEHVLCPHTHTHLQTSAKSTLGVLRAAGAHAGRHPGASAAPERALPVVRAPAPWADHAPTRRGLQRAARLAVREPHRDRAVGARPSPARGAAGSGGGGARAVPVRCGAAPAAAHSAPPGGGAPGWRMGGRGCCRWAEGAAPPREAGKARQTPA